MTKREQLYYDQVLAYMVIGYEMLIEEADELACGFDLEEKLEEEDVNMDEISAEQMAGQIVRLHWNGEF